MANYMDQGNDQLYKDSAFIKVGGQTMRTPTSINLSEMLKAPSLAQGDFEAPGAPQVGPIALETPTEGMATGGVSADEYLEASGDWQRVSGPGGYYYMPSAGMPGDFHVGPDDSLYEWQEGRGWVNLEGGAGGDVAAQRLQRFKGGVSKNTFHVIAYRGMIDNFLSEIPTAKSTFTSFFAGNTTVSQAITQLEAQKQAAIQTMIAEQQKRFNTSDPGHNRQGYANEVARLTAKINTQFASAEDAISNIDKASRGLLREAGTLGIDIEGLDLHTREGAEEVKRLIMEKLGGTDYQGLLELQGQTMTRDFGTQINELMGRIDSGEYSMYTEDGDVDIEGLKAAGGAQAWLGETLESAIASGFLEESFMQTVDDPDNPGEKIQIFSEEIQGVMDSMDESMSRQQQKFMKDLRLSAAQRGISPEDMIFNEKMLAYQTEAEAQFANEFVQMLDTEMDMTYSSLGNSLASMISRTLGDTKAAAFRDEFERQRSEVMKDYQHQTQIIAEEMAGERTANRQNIFVGLISAVGAAFMAIFGPK